MKLVCVFLVLSLLVMMAEPGDAFNGHLVEGLFKAGKDVHKLITCLREPQNPEQLDQQGQQNQQNQQGQQGQQNQQNQQNQQGPQGQQNQQNQQNQQGQQVRQEQEEERRLAERLEKELAALD